MTLDEAKTQVVAILKQVMEEKITSRNIEIATVKAPPHGIHVMTEEELEVLIS